MKTSGGRNSNIFQWLLRSSQNQKATTAINTVMTPAGDEMRAEFILVPYSLFCMRTYFIKKLAGQLYAVQ